MRASRSYGETHLPAFPLSLLQSGITSPSAVRGSCLPASSRPHLLFGLTAERIMVESLESKHWRRSKPRASLLRAFAKGGRLVEAASLTEHTCIFAERRVKGTTTHQKTLTYLIVGLIQYLVLLSSLGIFVHLYELREPQAPKIVLLPAVLANGSFVPFNFLFVCFKVLNPVVCT